MTLNNNPDFAFDVHSWRDWSAYTTRVASAQSIVAQICRQNGMAIPAHVEIATQSSNTVYFVERSIVIKLYCPLGAAAADAEHEALERLGSHAESLVPQVLGCGALDVLGWRYLIMTMQPGDSVSQCWRQLSIVQRRKVLQDLGLLMKRLHGSTLSSGPVAQARSWRQFVETRLLPRALAPNSANIPPAVPDHLHPFVHQAWQMHRGSETCQLHGDMNRHHVLVTHKGEHVALTGLIDFGDAQIGDPVYEMVAVYLGFCQLDRDDFGCFSQAYGVGPPWTAEFRDRWLLYALLHPHLRFLERLAKNTALSGSSSRAAIQSFLFD